MTTITLPVPTTYPVDPARLVAWLVERGYVERLNSPRPSATYSRTFEKAAAGHRLRIVEVPRCPAHEDADRFALRLHRAVERTAEAEGLAAHELAALLAPPPPRAAVAYVFRADGLALSVTRATTGEHSAPGGTIEPGETPEQAMRRELTEETGLTAGAARLVYEATGPGGHYVYAYLVEAEGEPVAREPGTRVVWVPVATLASGFAPGFHGPGLEAAVRARWEGLGAEDRRVAVDELEDMAAVMRGCAACQREVEALEAAAAVLRGVR